MDVVVEQGAVLGTGQWHLYLLRLGVGVVAVSPKGLSHKSTFSEIWIHLGNRLVIPGATVLKGASNSF